MDNVLMGARCTFSTPMGVRIFAPLLSAGQISIIFRPPLSAFVCGKKHLFLFNRPLRSTKSDKNWTVFFISADDLSSDILYAQGRGGYLPRYRRRGKQAYSFVRLCPPLSAVKEIISFLTARFARHRSDKNWTVFFISADDLSPDILHALRAG